MGVLCRLWIHRISKRWIVDPLHLHVPDCGCVVDPPQLHRQDCGVVDFVVWSGPKMLEEERPLPVLYVNRQDILLWH